MVHTSWNFCQVIFGVKLSGLDEFMEYSLFESKMGPTDLLTGGAFGPENSIITIIATTGLLVFLIWRLIQQDKIVQPFWRRDSIVIS